MTRPVAPRFGPLERARLWLSYQRFALLLGAASIAVVAAAVVRFPRAYWLWLPLALVAVRPLAFAATVFARFPAKLRATWVADQRIRQGRFRPDSVRAYCGDPCFRVVAREILRRAGMPAAQRRALVRAARQEHLRQRDVLVLVDRSRGVVFTTVGGTTTQSSLAPMAAGQDAR